MTARAPRGAFSLRLSVTDRCQLRCAYCLPTDEHARFKRGEALSFEEILRLVRILNSYLGLGKVHLTGGEPLLRRDLPVLVEKLVAAGVPDLALTTNGQRLAEAARPLRRAGLRRLNVSFDSLNPRIYRRLTNGAKLAPVLAGIEEALRLGFAPVKLNVVVLRGTNDREVADLARFGLERGCPVRFLELMPIGPNAARFEEWFVSAAEVRETLATTFELRPREGRGDGSSREYYARNGASVEGVIGFISSHTEPFCDGCRRLRLTATGELIGCLGRREAFAVKPFIRDGRPPDVRGVLSVVGRALDVKRKGRRFESQSPMVAFGG